MQSIKIKKISKCNISETRYDLEIEKNNNYFANNVLIHNCRCLVTKDSIKTRKGELFLTCPHITDSLIPFFKLHPDAVLDGELFNFELRQNLAEIMSILRKSKDITQEDLDKSRKYITLYIYDGYNFSSDLSSNIPYLHRKEWIDKNVLKYDFISEVKTTVIKNKDHLMKFYQAEIDIGQEGVILRNLLAPYENKRSKNLLKLKPEDDAEFEIVDICEGEGNWAGKAKIIHLRMFDGRTFSATYKGGMESATKVLQNKRKFIGKDVTIKYFGFTAYGIPNFAQFDLNNQKVNYV